MTTYRNFNSEKKQIAVCNIPAWCVRARFRAIERDGGLDDGAVKSV